MTTTETPAPSSTSPKHYWPLYVTLYGIGSLAAASLYGEIKADTLSYGLGLIGVPAIVGWLAMRKAQRNRQVILGYVVFLGFMGVLFYQETARRTRDMRSEIEAGCMTRNQAVAVLPQNQKKQFCGCFSDGLASWAVWRTSIAAASFRPLESAPNDPAFVAKATPIWNQCSSELTTK